MSLSGCVTLNEYEKKTNDRDVSRLIDDTFVRDRELYSLKSWPYLYSFENINKQTSEHLAVKI